MRLPFRKSKPSLPISHGTPVAREDTKFRIESLNGSRWVVRPSEVQSIVDTGPVTVVYTTYGQEMYFRSNNADLKRMLTIWRAWIGEGYRQRELYYNYRDAKGK